MGDAPDNKPAPEQDLATVIHYRLVEELAESERQHSALLDDLPDVVLRLDSKGLIIYVNRAWHRRFGLDVEKAVGSSILDFLHEDDRAGWEGIVTQEGSSDDADRVIRIIGTCSRYWGSELTFRLTSSRVTSLHRIP